MDNIFKDILSFLKSLYDKTQSERIPKRSKHRTPVEKIGIPYVTSLLSHCHYEMFWQNYHYPLLVVNHRKANRNTEYGEIFSQFDHIIS